MDIRRDISVGISGTVQFLRDRRLRVAYIAVFFISVGALSVVVRDLRPVVVAAALVLPLRVTIGIASRFEEAQYRRFSPLLANLSEPRFAPLATGFVVLPVAGWYFDLGTGWQAFGSLAFVVISGAVVVFLWAEGLYEKNFYFHRWHLLERAVLLATGVLVIVSSPLWLPLFLLVHRSIAAQFRYPEIGSFNWLHSQLPQTILLVGSSFAIADLILNIRPTMVTFLLLCGYAAHYFHPGIAKLYYGLEYGPLYYLRHNNPVFLFLNAYRIGWLSFLDEDNVLRIGKCSDRVKPLINLAVILIEAAALFLLFSIPTAVLIVSLHITLHLLIFLSAGDAFWRWIAVDLSILVGLLFVLNSPPAVFVDGRWFGFSILFIGGAHAWTQLARMGWLDTPYVECFLFEAELPNGETIRVNPVVFRPYDSVLTQGSTGTLTFLGEDPQITYSYGGINKEDNKDLHRRLTDAMRSGPLDSDEARHLVRDRGTESFDEEKTRKLAELIKEYVYHSRNGDRSGLLRYISAPREFYSAGFGDSDSYRLAPEFQLIRVFRIDGLWESDGFHELQRSEVLTIRTGP